MTSSFARVREYVPYAAPFVILALGWALLVRPISAENLQTARELEGLRQRLNGLRMQVDVVQPAPVGDPMKAFERQVAAGDPTGRLLEELSRAAGAAGLEVDTVESVEESAVTPAGAPGVSNAAAPDPRFALFEVPLKYSPVTLTASADYRSLGEFLWRLRVLPTIIEIRSLEVSAPAESSETGAAGTLRVSMTLFAYVRSAPPAREASE